MADSEVLSVLKALQAQFEGQTLSLHQTLQQYMTTVDSKIEDLCSQIQGSPGNFASTSEQPQPESPSGDALPSSSDNSPL